MIYLLLAEGFEEVEALAPLDLLRRANRKVLTVSITDERAVTGAHGVTVLADITAKEIVEPCDQMLILPGGMPGTLNLDASPVTDRLIGEVLSHDGYLAAICAAPLILGRRGILKEKQATCFPGFESELRGAYVVRSCVMRDGKIITANGMSSAILFGDALVGALDGKELFSDFVSKYSFEEDEVNYEKKRFLPDFELKPSGAPEVDAHLWDALGVATEMGRCSVSLLQRRLSLGFGKAARIIDHLTALGILSEPRAQKPRFVFMSREDYLAIRKRMDEESSQSTKK